MTQMIFGAPWAIGIFIAMLTVDHAVAQATNPTPTAVPASPTSPRAYVFDRNLYGQLRVRISFSDEAATSFQGCPKDGLGVRSWRELTDSDRTLSAGFTVTTPENVALPFEPIVIAIDKGLFRTRCDTSLFAAEYRSPLYVLNSGVSSRFQIKTTVRERAKPPTEVVQAISYGADLATRLAGVTAPLAQGLSTEIRGRLDGSGLDVSQSLGADIYLNNTVPAPKYVLTFKLGEMPVTATVTTELLNRASLFSEATSLSSALKDDLTPSIILGYPITPAAAGSSAKSVEAYLFDRQNAAYNQLRDASTPAELEAGCATLVQTVSEAGLTPTDQALVLWAMVQKHGLADKVAADQIACLQNRKSDLDKVGITLLSPPKPQQPVTRASTDGEMLMAVGYTGRSDNLTRFFETVNRREALAPTLFAYPLDLVDPDSVLMPADRRPLASADTWKAYAIADDQAYFTNFGCYDYSGDNGEWKALGRVRTPTGSNDYGLTLSFRTDPNGRTAIHAITMVRREGSAEGDLCPQ